MKLGRHTQARSYMLAAAITALAGALTLIRADPRARAVASTDPPPKAINYQGFFAPSTPRSDAVVPASPHTRTRAS